MSKLRQPEGRDEDIRIWGIAQTFSSGYEIPPHQHPTFQLVYASRGVMTVHTEDGTWVVPAHRAVVVPPETEHRIGMSGEVEMRTLYLSRQLSLRAPSHCAVVNVSPLLRELILHAVEQAPLHAGDPAHVHLIGLIVLQLETLPSIPLQLPAPRDPRARRAADWLRSHPGDAASLEQIARKVGASKRTLERLFQTETAMSLGAWRQQLRLMQALELLAAGEPVTQVALAVGYESTSAFISRFRQVLGTTPGRYYGA
ncbi:MAG TPA: helix-turn-helix transcriptional regulator [Myxococcota bacterium]|nr:helix-turn-helix transcriptional regulator [Myxococcota bacterium]